MIAKSLVIDAKNTTKYDWIDQKLTFEVAFYAFVSNIILNYQVAKILLSFDTSNFTDLYLEISELLCIFAHRYLK